MHINLAEYIKLKYNYDVDIFIKLYNLNKIDGANLINFYKKNTNNISYINVNLFFFNICQKIILIPAKFYCIFNYINWTDRGHGIANENINYFVNTFHIYSTDLGWNPLYILVSRKYDNTYNNKYFAVNYYYDVKINKFINDSSKTINFWQPFLNLDTLNDKLL